MNQAERDRLYDLHRPTQASALKHDTLRGAVKAVAELFDQLVGENEWTDEYGMFHEKLREALFWGNAHIACNE